MLLRRGLIAWGAMATLAITGIATADDNDPIAPANQQTQTQDQNQNQQFNQNQEQNQFDSANMPEHVTATDIQDAQKDVRISFTDAVRTAEQAVGGKAVKAKFCPHGEKFKEAKYNTTVDKKMDKDYANKPVYTVLVAADNTFKCVKVCAETGKVLAREDKGNDLAAIHEEERFQHRMAWNENKGVNSRDTNTGSNTGNWNSSNTNTTGTTGTMDNNRVAMGNDTRTGVDATYPPGSPERGAVRSYSTADTAMNSPKAGTNRAASGTFTRDTLRHDFPAPRRWQKAGDLIGKNVKNTAGENLGEIEDMAIDMKSGRILYGVLSYGGVMGIGDKLFAVPWQSLKLADDYKTITLNVTKDQLKNAKGFDKKNWPNMGNEAWAVETYTFYGAQPYWTTQYDRSAAPTAATYRYEIWYEPASTWMKASDLRGKDAKNRANEDIGDLDELAVDPDAGRVFFGIVSYNGKLHAIPWSMIEPGPNMDHVIINVTTDQLKNDPGFEKRDWPNFGEERTMRETYTRFNQPMYWDIRD